ncbi:hypothetical protein ACEQ8H_002540 [Pleosporales sp. CAS-2024a]
MAPLDRREHRQQRVRGAGPSSVQASFGFNFGSLATKAAKKASLPPQLSSQRTPVRTTPRAVNGSAQRQRSASIQRSGSSKRARTPKERAVTPNLGKRKRGSSAVQPDEDDGEADELSPDRDEILRAMEKSRRVVGTVSPIREAVDDEEDELSVLVDGGITAHKTVVEASADANGTPMSVLAQKHIFAGNTLKRTPIADKIGTIASASRRSISRKSEHKSKEPAPETPPIQKERRPRTSASARSAKLDTPSALQAENESEDELSPSHPNGTTPRVVVAELQPPSDAQDDGNMEPDELSSPVQATPSANTAQKADASEHKSPADPTANAMRKKRRRAQRTIPDEEDDDPSVLEAVRTTTHSRPAKSAQTTTVATPASKRLSNKKTTAGAQEEVEADEELDELSPDKERNMEAAKQTAKRRRDVVYLSEGENTDAYEEPEPEEQILPTPPRVAKRRPQKRAQSIKPSSEKPPRKRHRFLGPKHAISVMRIKGSTVRGITVADTTRTILEETILRRLDRMNEKLQSSRDSTRRKELRSELNMSLSFKESLDEKLLDLQDANDVLSTNFKKLKLFKRDNADLRKDILALQNNRQEVALEHDDVQAKHDAEKEKVDARKKLSEDMFSIEAAIQNGRRKARMEDREHEGPEIPLSMLLGIVANSVGSSGGGLLNNIKFFNGALERAAGWLEGRA